MIESYQLSICTGTTIKRAIPWIIPINRAMDHYSINTSQRIAAFLAQIGHESGGLIYTKEIWNPEQCKWQAKYEGRKDLGNVIPGDGAKFKGRGLIQITGRSNYEACGKAIGIDLITNPEKLEQRDLAALSAAWFWQSHGCNELSDKNDFIAITKRINGGTIGLEHRQKLWEAAKSVLLL